MLFSSASGCEGCIIVCLIAVVVGVVVVVVVVGIVAAVVVPVVGLGPDRQQHNRSNLWF